ncbi:MAG: DUF4038 domain-containing protein [Deltaproteobacteria bacterium]|nr:DUF4038 domain-containing protein [Deltaproteobacteria bacterium]
MLDFVGAALTFPLVARPGQHYLEDAAGKPFLIYGDSALSLIAQLTGEKVDLYLDDKRARGFNALLINLIEHRFSTNAPANAYGQQPFMKSDDYSTTNERHFAHADWVLHQAANKGFLVLPTPSYTGLCRRSGRLVSRDENEWGPPTPRIWTLPWTASPMSFGLKEEITIRLIGIG